MSRTKHARKQAPNGLGSVTCACGNRIASPVARRAEEDSTAAQAVCGACGIRWSLVIHWNERRVVAKALGIG